MEFLKYVISKKVQADINDDDDALAQLHHMARTVVSAFLDVASKHPERVAKIVQHYDTLPCHFSASPKAIDVLKELHKTLRVGKKSFSAIKPAVANSRSGHPWANYLIQAVKKIQDFRILPADFLIDPNAAGGCRNKIVARKWIGLPDLKPETAEKWFVEVWNMVLDESNYEPENHPLIKGKKLRDTVKIESKSQGSTFKDDLKRIFVRMVESKKG
jgi:hypothetical protein